MSILSIFLLCALSDDQPRFYSATQPDGTVVVGIQDRPAAPRTKLAMPARVAGVSQFPSLLRSHENLIARYADFNACLSAPDSTQGNLCRAMFDFKRDGDVDLRDVSKLFLNPVVVDPWFTDTKLTTDVDFSIDPIPAGFFDHDGMSCEAFSGVIAFEGMPIQEDQYGVADTLVFRAFDPILPEDPIGTERSVDIEMVALNLVSLMPINVQCDGKPALWNVSAYLAETRIGSLVAIKEHDNGGNAEVTLPFFQALHFEKAANPKIQKTLDDTSGVPVVLSVTLPWIHSAFPFDPSSPKGFILGDAATTAAGDPLEGCTLITDHRFAQTLPDGSLFSVHSHHVCPPDTDEDGWHDGIDNCRLTPNQNQANADGDDWGDACDNCRFVASISQFDGDGDEAGNACDNCPGTANPFQFDCDSDGIGAVCDADDTCIVFTGTWVFQVFDGTTPCFACCGPDDPCNGTVCPPTPRSLGVDASNGQITIAFSASSVVSGPMAPDGSFDFSVPLRCNGVFNTGSIEGSLGGSTPNRTLEFTRTRPADSACDCVLQNTYNLSEQGG